MLKAKIVLTGGPCAGKTTALSKIEEHLEECGYKVMVVSESATELIKGGIRPFGESKLDFDFGYKAAVNFFKRLDRLECAEKETKFALTNNGVLALIPSYVGEVKPGDMVIVNDNDYVLVQGVDEVITLKNNSINFDYDEIEYPFVHVI